MKRLKVNADETVNLLQFLATHLAISKSKAKALLDARRVFLNGRRTWMAQSEIDGGDIIEVIDGEEVVEVTPAGVCYQDEHFIIYNKPAGILTNGPKSLEMRLRQVLNSPQLLVVHRLDRDTSGCVICAHSSVIKEKTEELFRRKEVEKIYHAIVEGRVPGDLKEIKKPIDGKQALTTLQVLSSNDKFSHLRIQIATGRMHQIRKHLVAVRHPVVGEKEYVSGDIDSALLRSIPRQMLHARSVRFESPFGGGEVKAQAKLPVDFLASLKALKLS